MISFKSPQPRYRIYTTPGNYLNYFLDLASGNIQVGDYCSDLEEIISQDFGSRFAVCTPQARVGIYLTIKAIVKPGQKVILSPYTIADVINMVICAGAEPVFADIDPLTCNIAPLEIEKLIDKNTGAVMVTHLHGLSCPMDEIIPICKKHKIPLIEDAAQAFGAKYKGKNVGTFADAGIYSFGMYKNLTSFFGGMILTPHKKIQEKINFELSNFPFTETGKLTKKIISGLVTDLATSPMLFPFLVFPIFRFGHLKKVQAINKYVETELDLKAKKKIPENYLRQLTPTQARLALAKIDNVSSDILTRQHYARLYYDGLKKLKKIQLPPFIDDGSHIYTYFPIQFKERKKLIHYFMENHRDIGIQHLKNCAELPAFKPYYRDCPNARKTAEQLILLPTYPRYSEKEVKNNIRVIKSFFKEI
jgi:perosamine synthetase